MTEKLYQKMKDVCSELEIAPHVIRFWESEIPQLQFRKNASGHRIFSPEDVRLLEQIKHFLYVDGLTLDGVRRKLAFAKTNQEGSLEKSEIQMKLKEIRGLVNEMINALDSD